MHSQHRRIFFGAFLGNESAPERVAAQCFAMLGGFVALWPFDQGVLDFTRPIDVFMAAEMKQPGAQHCYPRWPAGSLYQSHAESQSRSSSDQTSDKSKALAYAWIELSCLEFIHRLHSTLFKRDNLEHTAYHSNRFF